MSSMLVVPCFVKVCGVLKFFDLLKELFVYAIFLYIQLGFIHSSIHIGVL